MEGGTYLLHPIPPIHPPPPRQSFTHIFLQCLSETVKTRSRMYQFNICIFYFIWRYFLSLLFNSILNFAVWSVFSVGNEIMWNWLEAGSLIRLQPAKSVPPPPPPVALQYSEPCPSPPPPPPPPMLKTFLRLCSTCNRSRQIRQRLNNIVQ